MSLQGEIREIAGELPLSHNAQVVLKKRYLKKDEAGETTEAAPDMFRRVADTIAAIVDAAMLRWKARRADPNSPGA